MRHDHHHATLRLFGRRPLKTYITISYLVYQHINGDTMRKTIHRDLAARPWHTPLLLAHARSCFFVQRDILFDTTLRVLLLIVMNVELMLQSIQLSHLAHIPRDIAFDNNCAVI